MKRYIALYRFIQALCVLVELLCIAWFFALCWGMSRGAAGGLPASYCLPRIAVSIFAMWALPHLYNAYEDEIEYEREYCAMLRKEQAHEEHKAG